MSDDLRSTVEELRGATQLAVEATKAIALLVKEIHQEIGSGLDVLSKPLKIPTLAATELIYNSIGAATGLVGLGVDGALQHLAPLISKTQPGDLRDALLSALNGVLGDYLSETQNPLAIEMQFRTLLPASEPRRESRKLVVLVHGLCMSDRHWTRKGHNHGSALERDLGFMPVFLHYNTGLHVSTNGRKLARLLEKLVASHESPIEELVILAHSMGGLVSRSACYFAEQEGLNWRSKLKSMVFLGTPHHGSPLERAGNWVDVILGVSKYSAPLARLGKIRSAGVTDLRYGNVLDTHWQGLDRFEMATDLRAPLPLPKGPSCFTIAGLAITGPLGHSLGDGLVPVKSALGQDSNAKLTLAFPKANQWVGHRIRHSDLLCNSDVYRKIHNWLEPALTIGES